MSIPFTLNATLGRSFNTDPDDILRTKQALNRLGHYSMPSYGLTEYPDESLFQGLETFQGRYGLSRDGIMKSGGETAAKLGQALAEKDRETRPAEYAVKRDRCARLRAQVDAAYNNRRAAVERAAEAEVAFEDRRQEENEALGRVQEQAAVLGVEVAAALILKVGFPAPSGLVAVVQEYRSAKAATARALNELDARRADVEDWDVEIRRLTNELSGLGC
jgi:hypothetical protein